MQPFTARRHGGKLVLEIDEQRFLADASAENLQIVDREQFLRFALANVFTLTHDVDHPELRATWWLRLTETLGKAAAATNQGVRQGQFAETACGCNPEEHDGG